MKFTLHTFGLVILFALLSFALNAQDAPAILDCTGPKGAEAATVLASQKAWAKHLGEVNHEKTFLLDKSGKITIEMVLLPPGKYNRGEGKNAVVVTLTQPLWIGKYEVTQQQYAAVMGINPSHFKKAGVDADSYPVEAVSHLSAIKFCSAVSENTGAEHRLLHEAEWEYAYRAGTRTQY